MHLRFNNLTFQSRWCATPLQKGTFCAGVVGGVVVGNLLGRQFFADKQLKRLLDAHDANTASKSETRRYHKAQF